MNKQPENIPVFEMHDVDCALAANTTPYPTQSASCSPVRACSSKTMGLNSNCEKSRNPWPGNRWPATSSSSLACSRHLPQSSGTVPCCVHSAFPLTRSTKQCYDAALKLNSSTAEYERTPNYLYNNKHLWIIFQRFPFSSNLLFLYPLFYEPVKG